jgi:hypothetical protein
MEGMAMYDISNIGIWEAFENSSLECPICYIEKINEDRLIKALYAEMVTDNDFISHLGYDYSFCYRHFEKLYNYPDKLGLAIILNNLISQESIGFRKYNSIFEDVDLMHPKSSLELLFSKIISHDENDEAKEKKVKCMICSRLEENTSSGNEALIRLWCEDKEFRTLYLQCRGFCTSHFRRLMRCVGSIKDVNQRKTFTYVTLRIQQDNMERLHSELEQFIKKHNAAYMNEPWEGPKDSVNRGIQKIIGNFMN